MKPGNQTHVFEFILLGITQDAKKKILFYIVFLVLYVGNVIGNIGMILVIQLSPRLHTPMYYFISNLSFIDFLLSSVIVPKTLQNLLADQAVISFLGCTAQIFGFIAMGCADSSILSLMAYDRYIAICHPLHYRIIMSKARCFQLVAISYIISVLYSMTLTIPTMRLPFCGNNAIPHFICEMPTLLKLACIDTHANYILLFSVGGLLGMCFFSTIFISYLYILATIMKYRNAESRWKAFSTCGSHLLAVTLFYGTASATYFRPSSSSVLTHNGVVSFFYTVLIPMLNPLIYSVRNKDVKVSLKILIIRLCTPIQLAEEPYPSVTRAHQDLRHTTFKTTHGSNNGAKTIS